VVFKTLAQFRTLRLRRRARKIARVLKTFLESASLIGLLLYSIWSRLRLSLKALVV
jgi:hypothetical protein